jgi:hypothetical protein
MNLSAASDASDRRRWLALAGLVAIPVYVLPVGLWGVRALWPRVLRDAATGAITLGMLSLVGLSLTKLPRKKAEQPSGEARWKLPFFRPVTPDEFAASAASGR